MNFVSMKCLAITSIGCPSFSYMARRKRGIMMRIMPREATLVFATVFRAKKDGRPMAAAAPKQRSCLFVRLNSIFDLTRERSRGTEMNEAIALLP